MIIEKTSLIFKTKTHLKKEGHVSLCLPDLDRITVWIRGSYDIVIACMVFWLRYPPLVIKTQYGVQESSSSVQKADQHKVLQKGGEPESLADDSFWQLNSTTRKPAQDSHPHDVCDDE